MRTGEDLRREAGIGSAAAASNVVVPTIISTTVGTAPSPASTGLTLTPVSTTGFPVPSTDGVFDLLAYAPGVVPTGDVVEILKVTDLSAGVWTIERQQYDSPAMSIAVGWELKWSADAMALDLRAYLEGIAVSDAVGPAVMKRTVYTSGSGTHTYDTETVTVHVISCGGGGAGGDADGTGLGTATAGGGGGGGGVAQKMYLKGSDSSCTYTVGSAGGASTVDPGAAANIVGNGGSAGSAGVASPGGAVGGAGGTATGGNMNSTGSAGSPSFNLGTAHAMSGEGGPSVMGGGGVGRIILTSGSGSNGAAGGNYGGGGGGAAAGSTGGSRTGGAGADGIIIIDEYGIGV